MDDASVATVGGGSTSLIAGDVTSQAFNMCILCGLSEPDVRMSLHLYSFIPVSLSFEKLLLCASRSFIYQTPYLRLFNLMYI